MSGPVQPFYLEDSLEWKKEVFAKPYTAKADFSTPKLFLGSAMGVIFYLHNTCDGENPPVSLFILLSPPPPPKFCNEDGLQLSIFMPWPPPANAHGGCSVLLPVVATERLEIEKTAFFWHTKGKKICNNSAYSLWQNPRFHCSLTMHSTTGLGALPYTIPGAFAPPPCFFLFYYFILCNFILFYVVCLGFFCSILIFIYF